MCSPCNYISDKYAGLRYAPDLVDLMNEIAVKFPRKWQNIGHGLGLEQHELDQILAQHGCEQDTNRFFSAVFDKWYRGKYCVKSISYLHTGLYTRFDQP